VSARFQRLAFAWFYFRLDAPLSMRGYMPHGSRL
jgi:hypothetical protein